MKGKERKRLSRWMLGETASFAVLLLAVGSIEAELHLWNALLAVSALVGMAICAMPLRYHPPRTRQPVCTVAHTTTATNASELRAA